MAASVVYVGPSSANDLLTTDWQLTNNLHLYQQLTDNLQQLSDNLLTTYLPTSCWQLTDNLLTACQQLWQFTDDLLYQQPTDNLLTTCQQLWQFTDDLLYQQPTDNWLTTDQQLTNNLLTTYQQLTDNWPTTYQQPTDNLPTTDWQLTNKLLTTYQQPTDNLPTTYLLTTYQQLTNNLLTTYQQLYDKLLMTYCTNYLLYNWLTTNQQPTDNIHVVWHLLNFTTYNLFVFIQVKFVEAILSNNSTDDHCREFVRLKGLTPLISILGLPNLPLDFPSSPYCQAVSGVSKSILVGSSC